jgi:chromosomal replication initiator protein
MKQEFKEIGDAVLNLLREQYPSPIFNLWFRDLILEELSGEAVFSIDSVFKTDYLNQHHRETVGKCLSLVMGASLGVSFIFREPETVPAPATPPPPRREGPPILRTTEEPEPSNINIRDLENPRTIVDRYTFENFLVADSNRFAYAAARAVARHACDETDENENIYNPLFIYGKSGLGKTHLLYAITNEIKLKKQDVRIIYKKGEDFMTELLSAIEKRSTESFRAHYRSADVLLIDDVHFIAGKEQTQEEFFHTFSALYEEGKQIILTSDKPPRDMKTLEERLRTRFEWGQLADIQPPSSELRTAIIRKRSQDLKLPLPADVISFLAENLTENIRQIEGALNRLKGVVMLAETPVTLDMCRRAVADFLHTNTSVSDVVDSIFRAVSKKYSISPDEIKGKRRTEQIASARHICIYLIRQMTELSLSDIGKLFSRDHATVISSIKYVEGQISSVPGTESDVSDMIATINA